MIKTFIAISSLFVAANVSAETFTKNGMTYTYTVAESGQAKIINGRDDNNRPFKLRVIRGHVDGHYDGAPVSFAVSTANQLAIKPVLASR